jgi:hypothetical protein
LLNDIDVWMTKDDLFVEPDRTMFTAWAGCVKLGGVATIFRGHVDEIRHAFGLVAGLVGTQFAAIRFRAVFDSESKSKTCEIAIAASLTDTAGLMIRSPEKAYEIRRCCFPFPI